MGGPDDEKDLLFGWISDKDVFARNRIRCSK